MCVEWLLHCSSSKLKPQFKLFQFILSMGACSISKTFGTLQSNETAYEKEENLLSFIFFFSQSTVEGFYFCFYSGTCVVGSLLVKYNIFPKEKKRFKKLPCRDNDEGNDVENVKRRVVWWWKDHRMGMRQTGIQFLIPHLNHCYTFCLSSFVQRCLSHSM